MLEVYEMTMANKITLCRKDYQATDDRSLVPLNRNNPGSG